MASSHPPTWAAYVGIAAAVIGVSALITAVTGAVAHWPFVVGGLITGVWAINVMHK